MAKEHRLIRLENLQNRTSQLEEILKERTTLPHRIRNGNGPYNLGQGELAAEGSSIEEDIKIGEKRAATIVHVAQHTTSILEPRLSALREEEADEKSRLKSLAEDYQEEVAIRRAQLEQIRKFVKEGVLSERTLKHREAVFSDILVLSRSEDEVRIGLELLAQEGDQPTENGPAHVAQNLLSQELTSQDNTASRIETNTQKTNKTSASEARKENAQKKTLAFDPESQEIEYNGTKHTLTDASHWKILTFLIGKQGRKVSRASIVKMLRDNGYTSAKSFNKAIYTLRKTLGEDRGDPQIIRRDEGKNGKYFLNAKVIIPGEESETANVQEEEQISSLIIHPDSRQVIFNGEEIKFFDGNPWRLFHYMAQRAGQPIPINELQEYLRLMGSKNKNAFHEALTNLRTRFGESGKQSRIFQLHGSFGAPNNEYILNADVNFIGEEKEKSEDLVDADQSRTITQSPTVISSLNDLGQVVDIFERPQGTFTSEEVIEVRYVPSEEEIRTDEETAVLKSITAIIPRYSTPYPPDIQQAINKELRIIQGERHQPKVYLTPEALITPMKTAFQKMEIESKSPLLIERWKAEDLILWEDIQGTLTMLTIMSRLDESHPTRKLWTEIRGSSIPSQDYKTGLMIRLESQTPAKFINKVERILKESYRSHR